MLIYDELHMDHLKVLGLVDELLDLPDDSDDEYRSNLIRDIRDELIPHARAEERVFYNAIRRKREAPTGMIRSAYEEHFEAETHLRKLQLVDKVNGNWRDVAERLRDALAHHIREEETQIFPVAMDIFSESEANRMGREFTDLKEDVREEGFMKTTIDMVGNVLRP